MKMIQMVLKQTILKSYNFICVGRKLQSLLEMITWTKNLHFYVDFIVLGTC